MTDKMTETRLEQSKIAYVNKKKLARIYLSVNELSKGEREKLVEILYTSGRSDLIDDFLIKAKVIN